MNGSFCEQFNTNSMAMKYSGCVTTREQFCFTSISNTIHYTTQRHLRVGVCLGRVKLPTHVYKTPILVPGKHHIATFLAKYYHESTLCLHMCFIINVVMICADPVFFLFYACKIYSFMSCLFQFYFYLFQESITIKATATATKTL